MTSPIGSSSLALCDWKLALLKGPRTLQSPVYSIAELRIGPSPSQPAYEQHAVDTIGSDIAWMDEWLFDKSTCQLKSLIWQVPDIPLTAPVNVPKPQPATLNIVSIGGDIGSANYRHFMPDRLICREEDSAEVDLCLNIAPDLDVLFAAKQWCGWQLRNPLLYLPGGPAPKELGPWIARYYDLVSEDTLDDLFERDPSLFDELCTLRSETKKIDHPSADYAAAFFAEQIDRFYPNGQMGKDNE